MNRMDAVYPFLFLGLLLFVWWFVCEAELVPAFMLPSPGKVLMSLYENAGILFGHAVISLRESFLGLGSSIAAAFVLAVLMDRFMPLNKALYPVLVITQTIPVIAIAPLLVLWLGYGMLPKVVLIFIVCFFPLTVGILTGFASADQEVIQLYRSMGGGYVQILKQVKIPYALDSFFSGLRIAAAYSIVGAVIAEWLGGDGGLGVYMTRVRKSFAFDDMFAVIILISVISLILIKLIDVLQNRVMPWKKYQKADEQH